jgi:hypothetical protein
MTIAGTGAKGRGIASPERQFRPAAALSASSLGVRGLVFALLLVILTLAAYYPVNRLPFIAVDDAAYVTDNLNIKYDLNWQTVKWSFTTFHAANWHPLTWLSHSLDCRLFFLNPARHHDVNLLLHLLNVLLLFGVLRRATGCGVRSFMVAALFAVHPINVESVAWVAERKNVLSMLFFLLALGSYRWYAHKPRVGRYCAVGFLFALGLMAKPQVVTFPCVLLLWDYWPLQRMFPSAPPEPSSGPAPSATIPPRSLPWLILEKLPLLALSAASAVITVKAQRAGAAMDTALSSYPFSNRLGNAALSYARYMGKAFWPSHLAFFYPHPTGSLPTWQIATALLFLLAVTAIVIRNRHRRYLPVGWFWFLGTLVPMIGLVQVSAQAMADRYAYLPFVGLFIMVCWGIPDWLEQLRLGGRWVPGVGVAVLLGLIFVTHHQLGYWVDDLTLWSHAAKVTSGNYLAEDMIGASLVNEGLSRQAIGHFRAAAAIYPSAPVTYYYIGSYEQQRGNLKEAVEQYKKVITLTQNDPAGGASLRATTFMNMSYAYRDLGDYTKAAESSTLAAQQRRP